MTNQISTILRDRKASNAEKSSQTVFAALLDSDLPPEDLSLTRLQEEARALIGAGIETTKRALSVASFHILDNPAILKRLREELISAIPDSKNPPPLEVYEKLPYLSACIEEGVLSRFFFSNPWFSEQSSPLTALLYSFSLALVLWCLAAPSTYLRVSNNHVQIICAPSGHRNLHVQLFCLS